MNESISLVYTNVQVRLGVLEQKIYCDACGYSNCQEMTMFLILQMRYAHDLMN